MFDLKELIGKKVLTVFMNNNKDKFSIFFDDNTTARFHVEGDCCSSSWIEHLTYPDDLKEAEILDITEQTMEAREDPEYEYLQVYETRFRTTKGDIVLEYRNSSNGYYGGYLVLESIS